MSAHKIRLLKASDMPHLADLSRQAQWNQTEADWTRLLTLAPAGCFGIEADGRIVASTTAISYAPELAWIGMVLTHPNYRGKGMATALLEHTLGTVKAQGTRIAKLDATSEGRPIYAKLGFKDECAVERWRRAPGLRFETPAGEQHVLHPYVIDPSFDRAYFGAYRIPLLQSLAKQIEPEYFVGHGYALHRPGAQARHFGPSVVRTRDAARRLLESFLAKFPNDEIFWDLLPDNSDAIQLAIDHGFQPARHLVRMSLACQPNALPLVHNNSSVFAIAGFEYG